MLTSFGGELGLNGLSTSGGFRVSFSGGRAARKRQETNVTVNLHDYVVVKESCLVSSLATGS